MGCVAPHPYHSGQFGGGAAEPLRPGGLELTLRAMQCAGFAANQRILDLGCGAGWGTQVLRQHGCFAIGLDTAVSSLASAAANLPGVPLIAAHAGHLPFADASLDGILAECSLSLIAERHETLAECHRVLRPGGRLAITDVFARVPGADTDPATLPACLAGMVPRDQVLAGLNEAGFHVECWEDHSPVLKVFMARLIFASDSADALWAEDSAALGAALHQRRPGYFLAIAAKTAGTA